MKQPFYYAILLYFIDNEDGDAVEVMDALASDYGHYRNFKLPAVIEALMTAKENGLLEESRSALGTKDELRIWYRLTDDGKRMINKLIVKK